MASFPPTPAQIFGPSPFASSPELLLGGAPSLPTMPAVPTPSNVVDLQTYLAPAPAGPVEDRTIDKLKPGSDLEIKTRTRLEAYLKFSRDEMKKQYWRWNFNEQKIQAYTRLTDYEMLTKELSADGATPPEPYSIVVPYTYATLHAAATFMASVLLGRKPMFPLLPTRGTETERARYMEQAIQAQLEASRAYEALWQFIWDSGVYSFGATRNTWETKYGRTIRWVNGQRQILDNQLKFAGNCISPIDPYAFFPDPRVPIWECNTKGDFIFTQMRLSESVLKDMEKPSDPADPNSRPILRWVKEALARAPRKTIGEDSSTENRRRLKLGMRGEWLDSPRNIVSFRPIIEGTVRLVPKDWGFGSDDRSQLWKFAFIEGAGILQAEPLGMAHDEHPYTACEPASLGHDFISLSMMDMIGPFQDILSWLVSSRMENVRVAINNQFVVDPARIDINDIRSSAIGRTIRAKQTAMGLPLKESIMQLVVQDVTGGHLADIQTMRVLADTITGVNDNMRGIQTAGGRRSATEARMSMQAGASRLSQMAIRISAQGLQPMVQQMIFNTQQFMPDEMWLEMTGDDGQVSSKTITPDMLVGDFNYQVSDGSLPFDKEAMLEQWKEILFGIARDPELRARYDLGNIFNHVAVLGGAKNIDSFKRQQPPMQLSAAANPAADPSLAAVGPAIPAGPIPASAAAGAFAGGR